MKFLSLLLGLVIFIAILYQTVFTSALQQPTNNEINQRTQQAIQTMKEAEELKQQINEKMQRDMDYQQQLNNH